jgi:hypothetical protein
MVVDVVSSMVLFFASKPHFTRHSTVDNRARSHAVVNAIPQERKVPESVRRGATSKKSSSADSSVCCRTPVDDKSLALFVFPLGVPR